MSMYQIITVKTPTVYAKDAPRKELVPPQMSFAEDAARCNAKMIGGRQQSNAATPNMARMNAARDRDAKFSRIISRLLSNEGEMSRKQITTATGLTDDVAKVILRQMREAGMVDCTGIGNQRKWVKA